MKDTTVLIIDEHPEVSSSLARALSGVSGLRIVAHTTNPVWAAEFAHHWKPQVILADFKLGPRPRPEMVAWLKRTSPESHVVVYSSFFPNDELAQFKAAGADLCLLKGLTTRELGQCLKESAGQTDHGAGPAVVGATSEESGDDHQ